MQHAERRSTILALATGGNFAQFGARLLISPLVPAVMVTFAVSKSRVGLVLTGMWAVYALFQYPGGTLGDRFDERRMLLVALGLVTLVMLLIAASPTFLVFGLSVLLLGAGSGLYFPVASSMLTKRYEQTGQALSVLTAGGGIAGVLYPALAGYLVVVVGWRVTTALGGAVAFLVLAFAVALTDSPGDGQDDSIGWLSLEEMVGILGRPGLLATIGLSVAFGFTFQGLASFFPTFLYEYWNLSETAAGVAFGGLFLLSSTAQPVVGWLSDRIGRDGAMLTSALLTASGLMLLLFGAGFPLMIIGVAVLGLGVSWPGVVQARIMDHFSDEERGRGFGFIRTIYMLFGSLGSVVVGTLADVAGWVVAYGGIIGLLSVVMAFLISRNLGSWSP